MIDDHAVVVAKQLGLPDPNGFEHPVLRQEYLLFLNQLIQCSGAILSDPYFFKIDTDATNSFDSWVRSLSLASKARLSLLAAICHPLGLCREFPSDLFPQNEDPIAALLLSLQLGTEIFEDLYLLSDDEDFEQVASESLQAALKSGPVNKLRNMLQDKGIKALRRSLNSCSHIESFNGEPVGSVGVPLRHGKSGIGQKVGRLFT